VKYKSASGVVSINGQDAEFSVSEDGNVFIAVKFAAFTNAVGWLQQLELLTQPAMSAAPEPVEPPPAPKAKPQKKVEPEIVTYTPVPEPVVEPTVTPVVTWNDAPEPELEEKPLAEVPVAPPVVVAEDLFKEEPKEKKEEPAAPATSGEKRRGRPPGSKNKPKDFVVAGLDTVPAPSIPTVAAPAPAPASKKEEPKKAEPMTPADLKMVLRRVLKINETSFPIEIVPTELGWTASCPQLPDIQGVGTTDAEAVADIRAAIADWHAAMTRAAEKAKAEALKQPPPPEVKPLVKNPPVYATAEQAKAVTPIEDTLDDLGPECVKCTQPGEAIRLALFYHLDKNPQELKRKPDELVEYAAHYMSRIWPRVPALAGKQIRSHDKQVYLARTFIEQYERTRAGKSPIGNDED
jgi:predicted RNase H-like HicB family nuclease